MNKCKTCSDDCVGMCAEEENYKPERALQWLGVAVMCWVVIAVVVLS